MVEWDTFNRVAAALTDVCPCRMLVTAWRRSAKIVLLILPDIKTLLNNRIRILFISVSTIRRVYQLNGLDRWTLNMFPKTEVIL